jgi:predicted GNAT family N-acyltransferase
VITTDFSIAPADFDRELADLRAVRETVFVVEQQVPPELEADALDPHCRHVLARDREGAPIGTGRLTPQHRIGRMAVLPEWRGRGVGAAMLQSLIDLARELRYPEVELHAQLSAVGFYEKFGFTAEGEEFEEAGIRHRTMRRVIPPFSTGNRAPLAPVPESREQAVESLQETLALSLQIVQQSRRRLWIYARGLEPVLYGNAELFEAIKRFVLGARGAELRVLLHDPVAAVRDGHALVALSQRLPSSVLFRVPEAEQDLQYAGAFLLSDSGGYLHRPIASRFEGSADLHAPGRQRQLRDYFEQVWERSLPSPELRPLGL